MISVPSLSILAPESPLGSTMVISISPSSTAIPFRVSLAVTSPAFPPICPVIGVALKSSSLATSVAAFTTIVAVPVSQFSVFKFSQIW